ncbi:MAG TPA: 6,7-dimethyl-8-ribityllumazine synthase [Bacteroidota bacterium]|nr:6,7-dimethyl-8-ribityllumazine synthase [Bacteroidota bacterium]
MTTQTRQRRVAKFSLQGGRFAIIVSRFHQNITTKLLRAALECFRKHGVSSRNLRVYRCPGAFELPQVANMLVTSGRWDAIVCLGAVVRGETPHFEYVAREAARGIQRVALKSRTPVVFGVLTTDTLEQAHERAGGVHGNKGWDAALAAMEMAKVFTTIRNDV